MKALLAIVVVAIVGCDKSTETSNAPAASVSAGPGGAAVQAGGVSVTASADGGARVVVPGLGSIQAK
jgi:hypothetical protein